MSCPEFWHNVAIEAIGGTIAGTIAGIVTGVVIFNLTKRYEQIEKHIAEIEQAIEKQNSLINPDLLPDPENDFGIKNLKR